MCLLINAYVYWMEKKCLKDVLYQLYRLYFRHSYKNVKVIAKEALSQLACYFLFDLF